MEDDASSPNISDSIIDFSLVNELLFDGFWLEATDGSSFWQPDPNSTSSDPTPSEINIVTNPHQEGLLRGPAKPKPAPSCPQMDDVSAKRLWVGPNRSPVRAVSVKKRLVQAINCLQDSVRDKDVLIQIWIPVKREGRQVLTTNKQPFSLSSNCKNLADYRGVSENYQFEAGENSTEFLGLPGRVFLNRLPEWTPDVRFFRREEYPRVKHAEEYDVRGSLALPVFEQGSGTCLGVVEIVTTHQKLDFHPEVENICKALQAVDLESSSIQNHYNIEDRNEAYQDTQAEIRNVLKLVCDTHALPLGQVWASCLEQRKGGCRHTDDNYARCISIIESACYIADAQVTGFHEACCQHHLLYDEGVPGKAFLTNQPCFSEDITAFSKTQYPLAHHARLFNLSASAAIRLRSMHDETSDFVLEFFLPINCNGMGDVTVMLQSLSSVVQQTCRSVRVITDEELARETASIKFDDGNLVISPSEESLKNTKGKGIFVSLEDHKEKPKSDFKIITTWDHSHCVPATSERSQLAQDYRPKTNAEEGGSFSLTIGDLTLGSKAYGEKRQKRGNKAISLQVLRQYFAGSLKEAAKNIGVCPTTLKRICRQHGITRWPSRKIKKVSHSLRKLQLVIDSVQGGNGSIQLSSFYNHFPELVSPNVPGSSHLLPGGDSQPANDQPEGTLLSPTASKSASSSGSHSSSSSYCCSTGVKQSSYPVNSSILRDALEHSGGMLKKARSDAELHGKGQEKTKPLIRSYSHKLFSNHTPTNAPGKPRKSNLQDSGNFRVKAAFGEEKIRLSLQPHWGYKDLRQEILGRFNLDSGSTVNLKYLDDDDEWVLLTCDDDLEECKDIYTSSNNQTIKLSLNYPILVGSFGSNGS